MRLHHFIKKRLFWDCKLQEEIWNKKELDGKVWEVSGFVFENEEQAKLAKKEVEGIQYIHDNMNMDNPEMVQEIYQRIMAQELFHTPIGYAYLKRIAGLSERTAGVDASENTRYSGERYGLRP